MLTVDKIDFGNVVYFASISKSTVRPALVIVKYSCYRVIILTVSLIWSLCIYPIVNAMYGSSKCPQEMGKY